MCDGSDGSTSEGSAPRPGCSAESCGARNEDDVANNAAAKMERVVDGRGKEKYKRWWMEKWELRTKVRKSEDGPGLQINTKFVYYHFG